MVLWAVLPVCAARAAESAPPGVLILHSNQRPTPAQVVVDDTLRAVVAADLKRPVQLFSEYLDDEWASLETYGAAEAGFIRDKYSQRNLRVIVADALPALQFATKFRGSIFAPVPVVFIAVARDRLDPSSLPPDTVGVLEDHDPLPTLRLAKQLHPYATRILIISGADQRDRLWEKRARSAVERLEGTFEIEYLSGLPSTEVVHRVSALSKETIVFTPGYFVDGAGQVSTPRQAVEHIAQASSVPVYGTFDTFLGSGVVGGYMTRYQDEAREAAAIVVRLLNGTPSAEIATSAVARVPMVDWHQLRRWHIEESLLPPDAIVMFREPTAWDKYGFEVSIGVVVLVIQAALIGALLFERRSRRRTADALGESQQQMSLAMSAARLSPWIWDTARNNGNATARRQQRSITRNGQPAAFEKVLEHVHPGDRESLSRAVWRCLRSNDELDIEYRVVEPDKTDRWIAARGRAEGGNSLRLLGVALDITERKAADLQAAHDRNALRHMSRVSLAGQLSAAIAHQVNQPLAAILGNAEAAQKILGRETVDLDELRAICGDIVSEDHRAAEVIRRLGELYKRGDMKIELIDLNELVRDTLGLLNTELVFRHVKPVSELAPQLPTIEGGHVQLQQVVLNLVLNAADATSEIESEERKLTVRTQANGANVRLYVVDNGTGIAPDHLETVFNPFWSTKDGGMGMGLAICKSIVASHGGTITAANNAEGGATFCVGLPTKHYSVQ